MKPSPIQTDHPPTDANYQAELSLHLLTLLLGGPSDFNGLVQRAEGAYPLDVAAALKRLEKETAVQFDSKRSVWSATGESTTRNSGATRLMLNYSDDQQKLPEPHPIDFDWRFTSTALKKVKERLVFEGVHKIAILGAPTLFRYLANCGLQVHLFDNNLLMIQSLQAAGYSEVRRCDLLSGSPDGNSYHAVFADPPWYVDYYQGFINASSQMLLPEGKLYLSVLPRLTRPSAASDRAEVFSCAYAHGFDIVGVDPAFLQYESPTFERASLAAEGFATENWRAGDLFTFILRTRAKAVQKQVGLTSTAVDWKTFRLGPTNVRVQVGQAQDQKEHFSCSPVSPTGDTHLHSVSRRSPVRERINIWTSRNVALRASRPELIAKMLEELERGQSLDLALQTLTKAHNLGPEEQAAVREAMNILMADADE